MLWARVMGPCYGNVSVVSHRRLASGGERMLLVDLFLLKPSPYLHACESPRATRYATLFLIATGVLYGALMAASQRVAGGEIQGIAVDTIPGWVLYGGNIASGVAIAICVHVGITVIAWLMARAIGGPGLLIGLYRTTAYLLPLGWPALPRVVASVVGAKADALPWAPALLPLAVLGLAMFLVGLFHVYVLTQGKGAARAALGVALFALFSFALILAA